jgi:hypothetical protein
VLHYSKIIASSDERNASQRGWSLVVSPFKGINELKSKCWHKSEEYGGDDETRTRDLCRDSDVLWAVRIELAGATGLEPATSCVTGRRSNQLNYAPASYDRLIPSGSIRYPIVPCRTLWPCRDRVARCWNLVELNGADSPSLEFQGTLCRDLLDPDETQVFLHPRC